MYFIKIKNSKYNLKFKISNWSWSIQKNGNLLINNNVAAAEFSYERNLIRSRIISKWLYETKSKKIIEILFFECIKINEEIFLAKWN